MIRGTEATTKMVFAALAECFLGNDVVIVVKNYSMIEYIQTMIWGTVDNYVTVENRQQWKVFDGSIEYIQESDDFHRLAGRQNAKVFVDNSVENLKTEMLYYLYMIDKDLVF